jgi:hypothetical protein
MEPSASSSSSYESSAMDCTTPAHPSWMWRTTCVSVSVTMGSSTMRSMTASNVRRSSPLTIATTGVRRTGRLLARHPQVSGWPGRPPGDRDWSWRRTRRLPWSSPHRSRMHRQPDLDARRGPGDEAVRVWRSDVHEGDLLMHGWTNSYAVELARFRRRQAELSRSFAVQRTASPVRSTGLPAF